MNKIVEVDVPVEKDNKINYEILPREADAVQQDAAYVADAAYEIATIALPTWVQPVDEALKLNAYIATARAALRQTKHSAAEAAVATYIVYRNTLSTAGTEWLKTAIESANAAIRQHNVAEVALMERVDNFKLKGAAMFAAPKTPEEAAEIASETAKLSELALLDDDGRARRMKVEIAARSGAAEWTAVTKLVLQLNSTYTATVTHRYVTVIGWLVRKFPHATDADYATMVKAILNAHGFDAVYADQVAFKRDADDPDDGSDDGSLDAKDAAILANHKAAQVEAGLKSAQSVGNISIPVEKAKDGYTLLLGRVTNGAVEVIAEADLGEKRIAEAANKHGATITAKPYDGSQFLWTVLSLGELVENGRTTALTRNGLKGGEALKVERRLVLRNSDKQGGYEVLVTGRYADSSIIVKATPNAEVVKLGPPTGILQLTTPAYDTLYDLLQDQQNRALWDVAALHNPPRGDGNPAKQTPAWVAFCDVLKQSGSANHSKIFYFNDVMQASHMPLDVDGFRPECFDRILKSDLVTLYQNRLADWASVTQKDKAKKTITLAFTCGQLVLKRDGDADFAIPVVDNGHLPVTVTFRAQDLHKVFRKLIEAETEVFDMMADSGGLLSIRWKNAVGAFEVNLPTVAANGELTQRRIAPMVAANYFFTPQPSRSTEPSNL
jgi:hypothetical protein